FVFLHPSAEEVCGSSASTEERWLTGEQALQPTGRAAMTTMPVLAAPQTETPETSAPERTLPSLATVQPLTGAESSAPIGLLAPASPPWVPAFLLSKFTRLWGAVMHSSARGTLARRGSITNAPPSTNAPPRRATGRPHYSSERASIR